MLNTRLEHEWGVRLTVRVGMHTGLVVVGEMGSGAGTSDLPWAKRPTLPPSSKGWQHLRPWSSVPSPIG